MVTGKSKETNGQRQVKQLYRGYEIKPFHQEHHNFPVYTF